MEYKEEKLKIEDTNIAMLGSELEKAVKLAAAQTEEAWKGVGQEPGLMIWRIEKFCVVPWPKEEYGSFFSGDSYIVLHTYKKDGEEALHWHAHMWVGTFTTMDEAGTAAYKIVELDDYFNRKIVLFREVQGYESDTFLSYFKVMKIMDGGVESGFKHVPVEKYRPRLLHIRGRVDFKISEVRLERASLNSGDVFILDDGLVIYNWHGKEANSYEKFKSASICESIKSERNGKPKVISIVEGDDDTTASENFWTLLGGKGEIKPASVVKDSDVKSFNKQLFQLSDSTGELQLKTVDFTKNSLTTDDVFIADIGTEVLIWVGKNATVNEKKNSIRFAHQYIRQSSRPLFLPISSMTEGRESPRFIEILSA